MDLQLSNTRVFISGSTTGIGWAIAKRFAEEHAQVILNGRTQAAVDSALAALQSEYPEAQLFGIAADLTIAEDLEKVKNEFPVVDILINNVGIYEPRSFFETTTEDWTRMLNHNVLTGIQLTQHFMPKMLDKQWGRVLFISSESGLQIPSEMIHYGVSKTAQLALVNGLAQLTKGTGVTVNAVLPGPTYSTGVQQFIEDLATSQQQSVTEVTTSFFEETRPLSLLQRFITPDEVASLVVYLASPLAAATNGASMRVDGGILKGL